MLGILILFLNKIYDLNHIYTCMSKQFMNEPSLLQSSYKWMHIIYFLINVHNITLPSRTYAYVSVRMYT